ncbi:VOC family protein [Natrarchaeobius sp. A-rgal3]|uniref:VOC family protein n=1 Tax=Natrarchaeobius versutus TaxID=1679078 RepID=UPI00350EC835
MAPSLHQSLLTVSDLETSVAFYEDVIGLETTQEKETNVEFETGQCTLVLEEDFDEDVLEAFGLSEPGDVRGEGVIVAIEVDDADDVDEIHQRAEDEGVTVRMEPKDVSWGRRMMLLADPDEYTIEISSPL